MLKKANALPGTNVVFKLQLKDISGDLTDCLAGYGKPGSAFEGAELIILPGDTATLVSKPKRSRDGINTIVVEKDGKQAHFYWIDIHKNATLVP